MPRMKFFRAVGPVRVLVVGNDERVREQRRVRRDVFLSSHAEFPKRVVMRGLEPALTERVEDEDALSHCDATLRRRPRQLSLDVDDEFGTGVPEDVWNEHRARLARACPRDRDDVAVIIPAQEPVLPLAYSRTN